MRSCDVQQKALQSHLAFDHTFIVSISKNHPKMHLPVGHTSIGDPHLGAVDHPLDGVIQSARYIN